MCSFVSDGLWMDQSTFNGSKWAEKVIFLSSLKHFSLFPHKITDYGPILMLEGSKPMFSHAPNRFRWFMVVSDLIQQAKMGLKARRSDLFSDAHSINQRGSISTSGHQLFGGFFAFSFHTRVLLWEKRVSDVNFRHHCNLNHPNGSVYR